MNDKKASNKLTKKLLTIACRQSAYIDSIGFLHNPDLSKYSNIYIELINSDGKCVKSFPLLKGTSLCVDEIEGWQGEPQVRIHDLSHFFTTEEVKNIQSNKQKE
ncbi:MAG: hypothetical protein RR506_09550 [Akkermansia sp.]